MYGEITNSIIRQIHRSRKPVTILFTDIEDSTRYWDTHGDVKGRLMVDQHNRLTFPVVKRFGGKIIKTIGDAIMASFKDPDDAIKAAIGIQQVLHLMREKDRSFGLKVRIGLHTGHAIVEDNDVFGNVVNVAARVESKAKGNEILLSKTTFAKLNKLNLRLTRKGATLYEELIPRLLRKEQEILSCLSPQERRDLARLLGKLEESLDLVQTSEEADAKEAY